MFSDLLKSLRSQRNLSQPQLAKAVGVSPGNISDWETGRSKPGYVALAALSRFFEVSADYLLELTPGKTGEAEDDLRRLDELKKAQGLTCDGSPLTAEETDLIAMYRLLPSYVREDAFELIYFQYKKHVEKKEMSIYWTYSAENADEQSGLAGGRKAQDGTA